MDSSQDGSEMVEAMEVETMVLVAEAAAEQGAFLDFYFYCFLAHFLGFQLECDSDQFMSNH